MLELMVQGARAKITHFINKNCSMLKHRMNPILKEFEVAWPGGSRLYPRQGERIFNARDHLTPGVQEGQSEPGLEHGPETTSPAWQASSNRAMKGSESERPFPNI